MNKPEIQEALSQAQKLLWGGSANIINIGVSDGNSPLFEPVMKVTHPELVKINTNPYN